MDGNEFIATAKGIVARKADDIRIGTVLTTQQMMKPIKENEVHVVWVAKCFKTTKDCSSQNALTASTSK